MPSQPFYVLKQFLRDLRNYDDKLRVTWDHKDSYWRIERKVRRGWTMVPTRWSSPADWECQRDGYVIVLRVPPDCLDFQVFRALDAGDIQKRGGFDKVHQQMRDHEDRMAAADYTARMDEFDQRVKARWTSWNTNYPMTKHGRSWDSRSPGGRG